ncbi:ComEC/Rec2 family competence protein [Kovacikia minuta CCNUW1]|uniref:ComEC/Rec2 family competence protein n=1 Tax=Kovacikia minuta TaxID=2931930 RepID=UPI001CCE95E4|nr:ComEC/Rec2 family competence protein [Kovacikia minuta]UBF26239.1 ComEC/Rec2 family competence protein [Kovacikia minuta CCNUW1]
MGSVQGAIFCFAYILGLLSTGIGWGGWGVLGVGVGLSLIVPRYWRKAPRARIWLAAGVVGLVASLYFQVRVPYPQTTDISKLIPPGDQAGELEAKVWGQVESLPHLTRSQKAQFWLQVQRGEPIWGGDSTHKSVTGRLYVTVPLLQATGLHPGQTVEIEGSLYKPKPAANPGAFDFQKYLAQEGCFAGLKGKQVKLANQRSGWGWWRVQQQIVRSQIRWLGSPEGPLVSAMVLGGKVVDLPYDLKDSFIRVGLAAALAASGFQTSLILGVVLALTRRFSAKVQFCIGTASLVIFLGLTGLQPSVLRAALMGFGGLLALMAGRKVKPLGAMLLTAVLLLVWNPLWIWDLGFQLSFLATLGLLVTVPSLTKWLDWLPTAIAPLFAVPIAAYLWTLPIQLYAFGILSPYSILVNVITTPFISVISIGGMLSALAALIWSPAGSALAWLLKYPTQGLITIVEVFAQLPGNAYAVGTISVLTAIALYILLGLTWLRPWWRKQWWLALLIAVGLVVVPAWQARAAMFRVTLIAASRQPVMVVQEAGKTALINSGDATTANFTILPFLQKEGVNRLDWVVSTEAQKSPKTGWSPVLERLPARIIYALNQAIFQPTASPQAMQTNSHHAFASGKPGDPLPLFEDQPVQIGSSQFKLISKESAIAEFRLHNQTWIWVGNPSPDQQQTLSKPGNLRPVKVLWWSGKALLPNLIAALQPEIAIAANDTIHSTTETLLRDRGTRLYRTGKDGAIQWTPTEGFRTTLERNENSAW